MKVEKFLGKGGDPGDKEGETREGNEDEHDQSLRCMYTEMSQQSPLYCSISIY